MYYTLVSHNNRTTHYNLFKAWTPVDLLWYAVVSGTKPLVADPLSCKVEPP